VTGQVDVLLSSDCVCEPHLQNSAALDELGLKSNVDESLCTCHNRLEPIDDKSNRDAGIDDKQEFAVYRVLESYEPT